MHCPYPPSSRIALPEDASLGHFNNPPRARNVAATRVYDGLCACPADASHTERSKKTPRTPPGSSRKRPWRRRRQPTDMRLLEDKLKRAPSTSIGGCRLAALVVLKILRNIFSWQRFSTFFHGGYSSHPARTERAPQTMVVPRRLVISRLDLLCPRAVGLVCLSYILLSLICSLLFYFRFPEINVSYVFRLCFVFRWLNAASRVLHS